jgi:hypothetical protein
VSEGIHIVIYLNSYRVLDGKSEERSCLEDLSINGWIILKYVL